MDNRAAVLDDARSISSFDTILPAYSEATVPSYASSAFYPNRSRANNVVRPSRDPQVLSISQSNLPLRFTGPRSNLRSSPADPVPKKTPSGDMRPRAALAHGDTSMLQPFELRGHSPSRPRTSSGFDDLIRMRAFDELTRAVCQGQEAAQSVRSSSSESRLLGDEWDSLAVETQREEINIRISELQAQISKSNKASITSLAQEMATLQYILLSRRDDVIAILSRNVLRLRELKDSGIRVSHGQKDQIKRDTSAMKAEIEFLEHRIAELEKFATMVETGDLQQESKTEESVLQAIIRKDPSAKTTRMGKKRTRNSKRKKSNGFGFALTGKTSHLKCILHWPAFSTWLKSVLRRTILR